MGGFLKLAGFRGVKQHELVAAVRDLYRAKGWGFEEVPLAPGYGWESGQSSNRDLEHVGSCRGGAVMGFAKFSLVFIETTLELTKSLKATGIAVQIYEGSQWSYHLAESGAWVDQYINIPDYHEPASTTELEKFRGRPELVAEHFPPLVASDVAKYFVRWTDGFLETNAGTKAYPGDSADYGDAAQMLDFFNKLGFSEPVDARGRPTGTMFR